MKSEAVPEGGAVKAHLQRPSECPACDLGQISDLIDTVVSRTVRTTLLQLGLDISDPIEIQRDMQYLRGWRQNAQAARGKITASLIGALVTACLILGVLGFKSWVGSWHQPTTQSQTQAQR